MTTPALGHALADLARGEELRHQLTAAATGGYDQWVLARQRAARRDYRNLVAGCLDLEAARTRWNKAVAYVAANTADLRRTRGDYFFATIEDLVCRIQEALADIDQLESFNPICQKCGDDTALDDPDHLCLEALWANREALRASHLQPAN